MGDRINLRIGESPSGPVFVVECGGLEVSFGSNRQLDADAIVRMFKAGGLDPDLSPPPAEVDWTHKTANPNIEVSVDSSMIDIGDGAVDLIGGPREGKLTFTLSGDPDQLDRIAEDIQERLGYRATIERSAMGGASRLMRTHTVRLMLAKGDSMMLAARAGTWNDVSGFVPGLSIAVD